MEVHKLSDLQIKSAEKRDKEYRLSEGAGLYLVVKPKWWKVVALVIRIQWQRETALVWTLPGSYAVAGSGTAQRGPVEKAAGIDPAAAKQARKLKEEESKQESSKPTFAALTAGWLRTWSKKKSARYVGTVETRLDRDILPASARFRSIN